MFRKILLTGVLSLAVTIFVLNGISGASISNPYTLDLATLVGHVSVYTPNCSFYGPDPTALTEAQMPEQDQIYDYPFGLVGFQIDCSSSPAIVTLTFTDTNDQPIDLSGYIYRKYGPTPGNASPHWYDFMYDNTTGAEISGNVVTLHFVEGSRGDDDLGNIDGHIIDQGGLGAIAIPTLTEWGVIAFVLCAGIISLYYLKRKGRTG